MAFQENNLFIDSLSQPSRDWLLARASHVQLPIRSALYKPEAQPEYAYFITSGIASVVTSMPDGRTAEVGVVGREGVIGSLHLLGPGKVPTDCFVQVTASALRIRYSDLQIAYRTSEEIRTRLLEFVQEQSLNLSQLAGCNRLHEQEERLARWLLMMQDCTQSDVLEITQEFLAMMLGAKRTTVTVVAGDLQRKGLIDYQRGRIRIMDRAALESDACSCYPVMKKLYTNLYKAPFASEEALVSVNDGR